MAEPRVADVTAAGTTPVARSPIATASPTAVIDSWEVSTRRSTAALQLADCSAEAKVLVRAPAGGAVEAALGVGHGRTRHDETALVVGSGPGEWLVLGTPGTAGSTAERMASRVAGAGEFVSVLDLTHGRALVRLTGSDAARLLAKMCAIDLSDRVTPDGTAFRSSVAKLATDVVRDDVAGELSYLLHVERSSGQYLFDALLDAGAEFGIESAGSAERTN